MLWPRAYGDGECHCSARRNASSNKTTMGCEGRGEGKGFCGRCYRRCFAQHAWYGQANTTT